MGFYDRVIFPRLMNCCMSIGEVSRNRERVVPLAAGRVLEIGIGSGLNLPFYTDKVSEVVGIEPHETLNRMAAKRMKASPVPVRVVNGSAEDMPFDSADFDTVVTTWTLCSIPDGVKALGEMRRVLKPGGQLIFFEHGRAPDPGPARWQDRLDPIWGRCAGGCHLNRPIDSMIREAGFSLTGMQADYVKGPRFLSYCYWGRATP